MQLNESEGFLKKSVYVIGIEYCNNGILGIRAENKPF
jgi:hypothetical protein